jgi:tetratricopeptide (TPR) repeat protein
MTGSYTYDELLSLESLQHLDATQRINTLSFLIEQARERKLVSGLHKAITFINQENLQKLSAALALVFHYNAANAYSYSSQLTHTDLSLGFRELNAADIEQEIIHLRKAFALLNASSTKQPKAQVCTNLGNSLSHVGRFVEAMEYWKHALRYIPNFSMAVGNLGIALLQYAHQHYDEGQRYLIAKFAYAYLQKAIRKKGTDAAAKVIFKKHATDLETFYTKKNLRITEQLDDYSNGRSNEEKDYRGWALDNGLFLNPLNDITDQSIANADTLFLPSLPVTSFQPPFAFTLFNQIKQEYASARYLFFEGLHTDKTHFSDRGNRQVDTLDYAVYGLNSEKMKIAYRLLYSLFDKIAFLLNDYFTLEKEHRKISFRTIWYKEPPGKKELYAQFEQTNNWPLRGLFWLSKDLLEKPSDLTGSLLPEAQEIATVRNFIEHKSFKIVVEGQTELDDDGKTYSIAFDDFYAKTMTLFKLTRSALIYLSLAVCQEERKKPRKELIMPLYLPDMEHRFKK